MESPADAAAPSFSQVTFTDTPHSYLPSTPITCTYTLCQTFQPHSRDWVGIFKVGWSSAKDYHTFVWVEQTQDVAGQQAETRQVEFKEYYLPKDDMEFYQFCYVDNSGQVRGASTPFCFRNPVEQSSESSHDDDLLVITTQEQVEQSIREKAELQSELDRTSAEIKSLKSALQQEQQQTCALKDEIEKKDKEMSEVVKELHQTSEDVKTKESALQQQRQEIDSLKEEIVQQRNQTEQKQLSQSLTTDNSSKQKEEKYSRAVMKINQLKEEVKVLRGTIDLQSEEIATLNAKVREGERQLSKTKDSNQLLQVDLQSSEKVKERLTAELQSVNQSREEMGKKNQELSRRLAEAEVGQSSPDEELKDRCQTLVGKLDETKATLEAEREEKKNITRKAVYLEREFQQVSEQLQNVMRSYEVEQRKSSKYELQLQETIKLMADKDINMDEKETTLLLERREKDELSKENETLKRELEGLRRGYAELHRVRSDTSMAAENIPANRQQNTGQAENLYETIGSIVEPQVEESLVCHLCQESFPGITPDELELHQQSHRVCPFCSIVCDAMEQTEFEDHVYAHEL